MSNASSCSPGWRDDDFLLFGPYIRPCGLLQGAQTGLCAVWLVCYTIALIQHFRGMFRTQKAGKQSKYLQVVVNISYNLFLWSGFLFNVVILALPQISINNRDQSFALLILLFSFASFFYVAITANSTIFVSTASKILSLRKNSNEYLSARKRQERLLFKTFIVFQAIAPIVCVTILLVLLVIVPETTTDLTLQQSSLDAGLTVIASFLFIECILFSGAMWHLSSIAFGMIQFHKTLSTSSTETMANIVQLAVRSRRVSVVNIFNGSLTSLFVFLIGTVIRPQYWAFHVVIGPPVIGIMLAILAANMKVSDQVSSSTINSTESATPKLATNSTKEIEEV